MQLIVFSDPNLREDEVTIIPDIIEITGNDFHLYKPNASKKDLSILLNSFNERSLSKIVLHHHGSLVGEFPVKGIHKARGAIMMPQTISQTVHNLIEPTTIHQMEYVFFSPIFTSLSKKHHYPSFSLDAVNSWVEKSHYDYYALGGVNKQRLEANTLSGFKGVAVLGAVWQSEDPLNSVYSLLDFLKKYQ